MKAREATVSTEKVMEVLDQLKRGRWSDPDLLRYTVGDLGKPAKNIIRLVGMFVTCRVHYVQDFVGDEEGVPSVPVCAGRQKCPICQVTRHLYGLGTEAARERAKDFYSVERNYVNVIPRWEYDYGSDDPCCKVLPFGTLARRSLEQVVTDYDYPGDVEAGYDIVFEVERLKGNRGSKYTIYPVKKRVKKGGEIIEKIRHVALSGVELDYDMVDLSKFTEVPSDEALGKLAEIFEVEVGSSTKKKRRQEVEEDDDDEYEDEDIEDIDEDEDEDMEDEDEEDEPEEDDDDDFLCFGDSDVYDSKSKLCADCPYGERCSKKVRLARIKAKRGR